MEEVIIKKYRCDLCKHQYNSEREARLCEEKPVKESNAKVGDIIIITRGDGLGEKAKVTRANVLDKYWGHYVWERYWHTVMIEADIIDRWGSRQLTFDDYKVT